MRLSLPATLLLLALATTASLAQAPNPVWEKDYPPITRVGLQFYRILASVAASDGAFFITGTSTGADIYTAKFAAENGDLVWETTHHPGPDIDAASGTAIAIDPTGEVVVLGDVTDRDFDRGINDRTYLAKLSPHDGSVRWEKIITDQDGAVLALDAGGNPRIAARTKRATLVAPTSVAAAKFSNADGSVIWDHVYPNSVSASESPVDIAIDPQGHTIILGNAADIQGLVGFGKGIIIFKCQANDGSLVWRTAADRQAGATARALALDSSGNLLVAGSKLVTLPNRATVDGFHVEKYASSDASLIWERTLEVEPEVIDFARDIAVDSQDNAIATGVTAHSGVSVGSGDSLVAKFASSNGATLWQHQQTAAFNGGGLQVILDASDNAIVTTLGPSLDGDGFQLSLEKRSADHGEFVWQFQSPETADSFRTSLTAAVTGGTSIVFFGSNPDPSNPDATLRYAKRVGNPVGPRLRNVSRRGNPFSTLADAIVIAQVGSEIIDAIATDATGRINFGPAGGFDDNTLNIDPDRLFDFEVKKGGFVRLYRNLRARDVADGTVQLALPVELYLALDQQLTKLEQTGLLVGKYNTSQARELMAKWNSTALENLPELPDTHADRDIALARLLAATDALAGLYASAEPLCLDVAKLITNTITSILAFQKAAATIQAEAATALQQIGSASGLLAFAVEFAIKAAATSLKIIAVNLQIAFVTALKTFAPAPVTTLVDSSLSITIATVLGGITSLGAWETAGGVKGGRTALLESLVKIAGEQVGGRIFATLYVSGTQQNLDLAIARARNLQGEGSVSQAYFASQQLVIDASLAKDSALNASSLVADTTKKWGLVADASQLVGRIPAAQIFAIMAQAIRGLNIALTAATAVNDTVVYTRIREDDAVNAPLLAFNPNLTPPAPLNAKSAKKTPKTNNKSAPTPLFPEYADALDALPASIANTDIDAAVAAGTTLLDSDPELAARVNTALLCADALARSATPRRPELDAAIAAMRTAATALDAARSDLYLGLAGFAVPGFADPAAPPVADLVAATTAALAAFEDAAATAAALSSGLSAPPALAVLSHAIDTASLDNRIPPGPFTLHATVTNTGSQPAENVTVTASPGESTTPLPAWHPTSPATHPLGTLAPGESRTLSWDATATDTSADGQNSAAVYLVTLTADNAPSETATGGFEIITPNTRFDDWVNTFTGTKSAPAFTDDPDNDGADSGRERFLGRHPGATDTADLELVDGALRHPRAAAPGSDAAATYLWSLDLDTWNPSGTETDGVTVLLEPAVVAGLGSANKTIELTPTITGDPDRLFFRLDVAPLPDSPPPPDPVPPVILQQPFDVFTFTSDFVEFSVTLDDGEGVFYQWRKDGANIPGATGATYIIEEVDPSHQGDYSVRILSPGGIVTSNTAFLFLEDA